MGFEGTFPTAVLSLELVTRRTAIPLAPQNEYLAADRAPLAIMLPQVRTPGIHKDHKDVVYLIEFC